MDWVHVSIYGIVDEVRLGAASLPSPEATEEGVAGYVDITADPVYDEILAGLRKFIGDPPAWTTFSPDLSDNIPMEVWWSRWTLTERAYLEEAAATDEVIRMYLRAFRLCPYWIRGDQQYNEFLSPYLETNHVGGGLLWANSGVFDTRYAAITVGHAA